LPRSGPPLGLKRWLGLGIVSGSKWMSKTENHRSKKKSTKKLAIKTIQKRMPPAG
jgi:hypothetical protein